MVVALGPNRASVANRLAIRLTDHGRPVSGARVRVSFSMPSMGMWNAYTAVLTPAGAGRYAGTVPVLGMAGQWQLRIDVAARLSGTSPVTVTAGSARSQRLACCGKPATDAPESTRWIGAATPIASEPGALTVISTSPTRRGDNNEGPD